ncbi:PTS galactitol transporter subunit IIB [Anaerobacillus alkalilacustris]|uniref:PTS galactitol transporter subunit IIB n=1 Tax=Anaerobacillus alkalilacustris TaxID=393763 RepID=A0A1S2LFA5_9BACI|nr:PTS sugar transporter subunit IIB [Anaerobacillus alkalilacustris]OIJ11188.1 PTS galactitol transporter subunit IIB [Anaerobacillus alkalilacustris]
MKKVIVACGSGVATSQTVASKVKKLLDSKGVKANVEAVDIKSIDTYIKDCAVYIAITKPRKEYPVPVCNGIAFLTGMGMDAELEKVIKALK